MLKRTPLFSAHQKLGARLVEFGGWEMPVQYTSIVEEHLAVRRAAGLFDISHMGEVSVSGPAAEAFLNATLTNDVRKLAPGQGQYTLMCNERGGVIDDLYVYRLMPENFQLIVNASRIETDTAWLQRQRAAFAERGGFSGGDSGWFEESFLSIPELGQLPVDLADLARRMDALAARSGVRVLNLSDYSGAVAVQGPRVREFIDECLPGASEAGAKVGAASELKKNEVARFVFVGKCPVWVSSTGYTGEDGFEIVVPTHPEIPGDYIGAVWDKLLAAAGRCGVKPCGLGARDTLRTEVCYPLYGHELDENTTPIEAGVGFFVALDKGDFVGRAVLAAQKANGATKKLVAFKMTDKSPPPRPQYAIWSCGACASKIGEVTSGTQSPSLNVGIGMGYVPPDLAKVGKPMEIEIRGRRYPAVVVPKPIYRKSG